ncbi:MAG: universal stress protein [Euryarchaeota archaeon]|nr:universal stress protein [Euryarchaeota archaeon]
MVYKRILVTNMGEFLDEIVENSLDLIHGRKVEVIGIFVVDTSVPFLTPSKVKDMMIAELEKKGGEVLSKMEKKFQKPNITFRGTLRKGDPADEIVKVAERENVDVIVMGTGKTKIDKHLLGSVSEKVVHSAPCNILLIRKQ